MVTYLREFDTWLHSCENTPASTASEEQTPSKGSIMPMFVVNTNVAKGDVPSALLTEASAEMTRALDKPEKNMTVRINPDQMMLFGGKGDPCALCYFYSIYESSHTQKKEYSKILCGLLNKYLGISVDRIYIFFTDIDATTVGWNNTTFG